MPNESFEHHVNEEKHDVANWVEHSVKDKELASNIQDVKTKGELSVKVHDYVQELKKRIHMGEIINKINSFTIGLFHKKSGENVEATISEPAEQPLASFPDPIDGEFAVSANEGQELAQDVSETKPPQPQAVAPEPIQAQPDVPPMPAEPASPVEVAPAPAESVPASASGFPTAVAQGGAGEFGELASEVGVSTAAPTAQSVAAQPVAASTPVEPAPTSLAMSMGAQPAQSVEPAPAPQPVVTSTPVESVPTASGFPTAVAQGGSGEVSQLASEVGVSAAVSAPQPVAPQPTPQPVASPVQSTASVATPVEEQKEVPAGLLFPK